MRLISAAVAVTPSRMFSSAVVEVTPSRMLSSAAVEVTPSRMLSSAGVDVISGLEPGSAAKAAKKPISAVLPMSGNLYV